MCGRIREQDFAMSEDGVEVFPSGSWIVLHLGLDSPQISASVQFFGVRAGFVA